MSALLGPWKTPLFRRLSGTYQCLVWGKFKSHPAGPGRALYAPVGIQPDLNVSTGIPMCKPRPDILNKKQTFPGMLAWADSSFGVLPQASLVEPVHACRIAGVWRCGSLQGSILAPCCRR